MGIKAQKLILFSTMSPTTHLQTFGFRKRVGMGHINEEKLRRYREESLSYFLMTQGILLISLIFEKVKGKVLLYRLAFFSQPQVSILQLVLCTVSLSHIIS